MQEFLGIDKALRRVQGEILNNAAKLSELDKQLAHDQGKLKEINDNPSYSEELKDRIRERIDNAETERQARLEVFSQNKNELQNQETSFIVVVFGFKKGFTSDHIEVL